MEFFLGIQYYFLVCVVILMLSFIYGTESQGVAICSMVLNFLIWYQLKVETYPLKDVENKY